mgnify:FL=1|jgi:hypothetical protein
MKAVERKSDLNKRNSQDKNKHYSLNKTIKVDSGSGRLMTGITSAFLLYMLVIYPLALHDHYFDITYTKYTVFKVGVILFAVIWAMGLVIVLTGINAGGMKGRHAGGNVKVGTMDKLKAVICDGVYGTDICMVLFFISGVMSFIMAEDKKNAFTGAQGRYCGLAFMILIFIMYIIVSAKVSNMEKMWSLISMVFVLVSSVTFIIAILQNIGFDPFKLLDGINRKQRNIYVSTFGNIDIFGSFICIALPLFMGLYVTEKSNIKRIVYGIGVFAGFMAFIPANADVVFAGVGAAIIAVLFATVYMERVDRLFELVMLGSGGYLGMVLLRMLVGTNGAKITGFNRLAEHPALLVIIFAVVLFIRLIIQVYINKNKTEVYINKQKNGTGIKLIIALAVVLISGIAVIIYGRKNNLAMFDFNDKWGSYRGYIWRRVTGLYGELPFVQKIFGHGNESIRSLMDDWFYDEMLQVTGTVYDNAHNEYLQYLVTQGLLGMLSYVGVVVTAAIAGVKKIKKSPYILGLLLAVVSYGVQAIFNVNQCITTPYMFLMTAMLIGTCRRASEE